jgi:hypothetical protein
MGCCCVCGRSRCHVSRLKKPFSVYGRLFSFCAGHTSQIRGSNLSFVLTLFLVPITSLIGRVPLWFRQFGRPLSSSMRLITLSSVNECVVVLFCRLSDGYSMNGVVCHHIFSSIYRSFFSTLCI